MRKRHLPFAFVEVLFVVLIIVGGTRVLGEGLGLARGHCFHLPGGGVVHAVTVHGLHTLLGGLVIHLSVGALARADASVVLAGGVLHLGTCDVLHRITSIQWFFALYIMQTFSVIFSSNTLFFLLFTQIAHSKEV